MQLVANGNLTIFKKLAIVCQTQLIYFLMREGFPWAWLVGFPTLMKDTYARYPKNFVTHAEANFIST